MTLAKPQRPQRKGIDRKKVDPMIQQNEQQTDWANLLWRLGETK
jgi:hypothetical protein